MSRVFRLLPAFRPSLGRNGIAWRNNHPPIATVPFIRTRAERLNGARSIHHPHRLWLAIRLGRYPKRDPGSCVILRLSPRGPSFPGSRLERYVGHRARHVRGGWSGSTNCGPAFNDDRSGFRQARRGGAGEGNTPQTAVAQGARLSGQWCLDVDRWRAPPQGGSVVVTAALTIIQLAAD